MRSTWREWLLAIWLGVWTGCATGNHTPELDQRYRAASRALDEGRWELAARHFYALWQDDDASNASVSGWARALLGQGQPDSALSILLVSRERQDDAELAYLTGRALEQLDRPGAAREAYAGALALDPDRHDALTRLGHSLAQAGDAEGAAPLLLRAAKLAASDFELARAAALAAGTAGQEDLESEALQLLIEQGEARPDELLRGAQLLLSQGTSDFERNARAEAWLTRAVELDPQIAPAWTGLARMRASRGEVASAMSAYERAVEADPSESEALLELAQLSQQAGRLGRARTLVEHALSFLNDPKQRTPFEGLRAELDAAVNR